MFTGLVEACAPMLDLAPHGSRGEGARLLVGLPPASLPGAGPWAVARGDSVAVAGACLTVAAVEERGVAFELSAETLATTHFRTLGSGAPLNLERALRLSDRLGGHLVSGHVDGIGRIVAIEDPGDGGRTFTFEIPAGLERYLVSKGSIALDGVSLTVVRPAGRRFDVAVIPETLARTSLGAARPGQAVHVEADLVGKWIERLAVPYGSG